MQLSKRLSAVSDMVTSTGCLADVGTDHGYIPIFLVEEGRIPRAIAMDINQGPLERAREHIRQKGLEEQIETRQSDGVAALKPGEAKAVVIAGMGGGLVQKILKEGEDVLRSVSQLILQPQSELEEVRRFLQKEGYAIEEEEMILEDGKYYPMMRVVHGSMELREAIEFKYGPFLLKGKHPCLNSFLEREEILYERVRAQLEKWGGESSFQRLAQVTEELRMIREAKERMR